MQQRAEKRPSNSVAAKEIISRWRRLVKANRITTNEADDFVNDKMMGMELSSSWHHDHDVQDDILIQKGWGGTRVKLAPNEFHFPASGPGWIFIRSDYI